MNFSTVFRACAIVASVVLATTAPADDGHDHGEAKPVAAGEASPRFTAQSDLFEAVGVLGKGELVLYIDRAASNEPVINASVELVSTGIKLMGTFEPKLGEYHFDAKPFAKAGEYPITLTIRAGADSDLLIGDLDVHDASNAEAKGAPGAQSGGWQRVAFSAGAVIVLTLLVWVVIRRVASRRRNRLGVTA